MSGWATDELARIRRADELEIASRRPDGTLRRYVKVWSVRAGDDIYVRSAYGYDNSWFQRALRSGEGRVRAGGVERDARFQAPGPETADAVSEAYHAKFDRYGPRMVGTVVSPEARRSTLRVVPGRFPDAPDLRAEKTEYWYRRTRGTDRRRDRGGRGGPGSGPDRLADSGATGRAGLLHDERLWRPVVGAAHRATHCGEP